MNALASVRLPLPGALRRIVARPGPRRWRALIGGPALGLLAWATQTVAAQSPGAAAGTNPPPTALVPARLSVDPGEQQAGLRDGLNLLVAGQPAATYVVQGSTDATTWVPLATNATTLDGLFSFTDAAQFPHRYYRAVALPTGGALSASLFRPDRLLVKPKPGADLTALNLLLGTSVLAAYPAIGNLMVLQVPVTLSLDDALTTFLQSGLVIYAERDYLVHPFLTPNDFRYNDGSLWGLHNTGIYGGKAGADIDAPDAWDVQHLASNVVVAVIDTGIRYTHEDLAANMWTDPATGAHGTNTIAHSNDPNDDYGHGSHVAGVIGAVGNNSVGVVGVAWQTRLMACKFLDAQGNGSVSDAVACIDYARAHGAAVINASWGGPTFTSQALHDAIAAARDADIIFVAAAGNSAGNNDTTPVYPASYRDLDNVIAVAATTRTDDMPSWSNYGATNVDLAAPGAAIFSCGNASDSDYSYMDGTSFSCAHVSGACAILRAHFPNETHQQLISRILADTDPLPSLAGKCVTGGRLNLFKALGGTTPPTPPTVTVVANQPHATETGSQVGQFTVSRTGSTAAALTVSYTLSGTATNGVDYQQLSGAVTIPAGASAAPVTVTPLDATNDVEGEPAKTVVLTVSANSAYQVGTPSSDTVTIADNDASPPPTPPTVEVTASVAFTSESGMPPGQFTITRSGPTDAPLTVHFLVSGSAVAGVDYQTLPATATIPAGANSVTVSVVPLDDLFLVELGETVVLSLASDPTYQVGASATATVNIVLAVSLSPGPARADGALGTTRRR